jgi:hypothetical protein
LLHYHSFGASPHLLQPISSNLYTLLSKTLTCLHGP